MVDGIQGQGHFVGTRMGWGINNNGWWGEGEIKFYIDGDGEFPTICGTGTEDYFGGSYNWDVDGQYREYSTPFLFSGFRRKQDIRGYDNLVFDMADGDARLWPWIEMVEAFNYPFVRKWMALEPERMSYPEDLGMQMGPMLFYKKRIM